MAKEGEPGIIDLLVTLSETAPDDAGRAYLGAGAVEDFVHRHQQTLRADIEAASRQSESFAIVLSYIW